MHHPIVSRSVAAVGILWIAAAGCAGEVDQHSTDDKVGEAHYASFGATIEPGGAQPIGAMNGAPAAGPIKLRGTITDVCQRSGCWLRLDDGSEDGVLVTFKDYGFFVPKDCVGQEAILEGVLEEVEESVEDLRHMAEDAGKTAEEIAAITEPKQSMRFEASGVLINRPAGS